MATFLGDRFSAGFSGPPPRMSIEDFAIWQRWRPMIQSGTLGYYFDVGLGLPAQLPEESDPAQLAGWIRNNQKRADVLVERVGEVWLVELRFNAQSSAIGRLATYQTLLAQDNPLKKPVKIFLVTNYFDPEVREVAESLGINYVVV